MKLGEFIIKVEKATGTSIQDPRVLDRELLVADDMGEHPISGVDADGDVIVLNSF